MRGPIVWKRRKGIGGGDGSSAMRAAQMTVARTLVASAQTIPRESITGVDATIKVLSAELTFHRLGGNPLTVTKVPKDAAKAIVALLS